MVRVENFPWNIFLPEVLLFLRHKLNLFVMLIYSSALFGQKLSSLYGYEKCKTFEVISLKLSFYHKKICFCQIMLDNLENWAQITVFYFFCLFYLHARKLQISLKSILNQFKL